jgi:Tol biopolymer transport system component
MGRTGDAVRRVTREGFNPGWSPDGRRLIYSTGRMELRPQNSESVSELWFVDADGSNAQRLYGGDATLPSWSPGGERIAFGQRLGTDRNISILTIAVTGGEPVLIVASKTAIDWNPIWSPDGQYLYFSSDRGGSMNLWRVGIDEISGRQRGNPEPITTPAPFAAHLSISRDGRQLAFSSVLETQNIQRLEIDPVKAEPIREPRNLTTGTRRWSSPDPSPDGRWVAFYSQIQPEGDLYLIKADGTGLRQLTSDPAIDRVPRWSPDGKWIAAFSDRNGRLQVWKIRPDGSDLQQVTDGPDHGVLAWAPDGHRLAATRARVGQVRGEPVVVIDPDRAWNAQTPQLLPPPSKTMPEFVANGWSPDGLRIAGQNGYVLPGVSVYSVPSRAYTRVSEIGEWPVWFPDGRRLLVVSRGREFHVIDTVARTSRLIFSVPRDTLGPPRLTADGRAAYFSRRVTEADVWLVNLQ